MTGKNYRPMQNRTGLEFTGMPGVSPHNRGIKDRSRNSCLPRNRRIPRKPSPAQIARFEALRARVMGYDVNNPCAGLHLQECGGD